MEILSKRGEKKTEKKSTVYITMRERGRREREPGQEEAPAWPTTLLGLHGISLRHLTSNGHSVKEYFLSIHSLPDTVVSTSIGLP